MFSGIWVPDSFTATADASENGQAGSFHFQLTDANGSPYATPTGVSVNYTLGGTASAGTQYATLGTITIPAGSSSADMTLNAIEDNATDPTLTVALNIVASSQYAVGNGSASCNVYDGDTRTVSIGNVTLDSGGSEEINVNVTGAFSGSDSVNLSIADTNIFSFTPIGSPWFSNGTTEVQTFQLNGRNPGSTQITATDAAGNSQSCTATVATPLLSVTSTADAQENGQSGNFHFALVNPDGSQFSAPADIPVSYSVGGSAFAGSQYNPLGTIVIPAGQSSVDVPVQALDDNQTDPTLSVAVTLSSTTQYSVGTGWASCNIYDGDSRTFSFGSLTILSGQSSTVEIDLSGLFSLADPISLVSSNANISGILLNSLMMNSGFEAAVFQVTAGNPGTAQLTAMDEAGNENSIQVTIGSSVPVLPTLSVALTADATEDGQSGNFHFALTNADGTPYVAPSDLAVPYTLGGSASVGTQFAALGNIIIPAGQSSADVPLRPIDDSQIEPTLNVVLGIGASSQFNIGNGSATCNLYDGDTRGITLGDPIVDANGTTDLQVTVTGAFSGIDTVVLTGLNSTFTKVVSNSVQPSGNVEIADFTLTGGIPGVATITATDMAGNIGYGSLTVVTPLLSVSSTADATENGQNGNFHFSLMNPDGTAFVTPGDMSVNYSAGGTAAVGTQYVGLGAITIPAGSSSVDVPVQSVDDNVIDPTLSVAVTLGSSGSYALGSSYASCNLYDGDTRSVSMMTPITMNPGDSTELDVTVSGAFSGTDMVTPGGFNSNVVTVTPIGSPFFVNANTELARYTLVGGTSGSTQITFTDAAGNPGYCSVIVNSVTPPPPALPTLSTADIADAFENGANGDLRFTLTNADGSPFVATSDVPIAFNIGGSAIPSTQYLPLNAIVIPAGTSSVDVPVQAIDDNHIDSALDVTVTPYSTGQYTADGSIANCNINDGDARTITVGNPTVDANGTTDLQVTVTGALSGIDTVTLAGLNNILTQIVSNGVQMFGGYEIADFTLTGGAPGTDPITATDQAGNTGDGSLTVATPLLSVAATADAFENGQNGNFNFSLTNPDGTSFITPNDFPIAFNVGGTAIAGTHYMALGAVTIPAGSSSVNEPVQAIDDNFIDPTLNVTMNLTSAGSYAMGSGYASCNLYDGDTRSVVISPNPMSVQVDGTTEVDAYVTGSFSGSDAVTLGSSGLGAVDLAQIGDPTFINAGTELVRFNATGRVPGVLQLTARDMAGNTGEADGTVGLPDITVSGETLNLMAGQSIATLDVATVTGAMNTESLSLDALSIPNVSFDSASFVEEGDGTWAVQLSNAVAGNAFAGVINGNVTVTENYNAVATPPESADIPTTITAPEISVAAGGDAYQIGPIVSTFTFSRTGDSTNALSFNFSLGGTANPTEYTLTDQAGHLFGGTDPISIGFEAGQSSFNLTLTPIFDGLIEQDDTVVATVNGLSSGQTQTYIPSPGASSATITIHKAPVLVSAMVTQDATGLASSEVAPPNSGDVYIPETSSGSATISLNALFTMPNPEAGQYVSYSVTPDGGGSGFSDNFGNSDATDNGDGTGNAGVTMTLTPTGSNMDFTAKVWVNGTTGGSLSTTQASTIRIHVYTVDVEFNGTPETDDDAVMLSTVADGAEVLTDIPALQGSAHVVGDKLPADLDVTIDSPGGGVAFCAPGSTTAPSATQAVTLPADGDPTFFAVVGQKPSAAVGDAAVRIRDARFTQLALATVGVTVFWFQDPTVAVLDAGAYAQFKPGMKSLSVDRSAGHSTDDIVTLDAGATLMPADLSPTIPQISNLRIGIVQNAVADKRTSIYSNPVVDPASVVATGDAKVPSTMTFTRSAVAGAPLSDSLSSAGGLYATPFLDNSGSAAAQRLCDSSVVEARPGQVAEATSTDNPETPGVSRTVSIVVRPGGHPLGDVNYTLSDLKIQDTFRDFCVICIASDTDPHSFTVIAALRETGWSVNADGVDPSTLSALPNSDGDGGSAPVDIPELGGGGKSTFNTALKAAKFSDSPTNQRTTVHFQK